MGSGPAQEESDSLEHPPACLARFAWKAARGERGTTEANSIATLQATPQNITLSRPSSARGTPPSAAQHHSALDNNTEPTLFGYVSSLVCAQRSG